MGVLIFLLLLPLSLIIAFGIPILIAVFVYRDASKREDCSPGLWALVAALVPSFIGLVIYMLVRNDFPLKDGSASSYRVNSSGESYYKSEYENNAIVQKTFPSWAKVLIIIIAVLLAILIIVGIISAIKYLFGYATFHGGFYY